MKYEQLINSQQEQLDEVSMSPSNLQKFMNSPEAEGIRAGFEAELIFPGLGGSGYSEDDYESEPDYDYDERAVSISQIINFFRGGEGFLSSRRAEQLQEEMLESYYEWRDDKIISDFESEAVDLIKDYISAEMLDEHKIEIIREYLVDVFDLNEAEIQKLSDLDEEFLTIFRWDDRKEFIKKNPTYSMWREAANSLDEYIEKQAEKSVAARDEIWDSVYEEYLEDNSDTYDEEDWLKSEDLDYMSDVEQRYSLDWPYYTSYYDDEESNNGYNEDNASDLAKGLAKVTGMRARVSSGYHSARRDDVTWIFEPDSSLEADSGDMPIEIISPPMPLKKCYEMLSSFFEWASLNNAESNSSTGFHMGVSLPFVDGRVDYLKLALFLGDEYVLNQFGRAANQFTVSALKKLKTVSKDRAADALFMMRKNLIQLANQYVVESGKYGKYTSINMKNDYIEFRSAGGNRVVDQRTGATVAYQDYFSDVSKLQNLLLRYSYAMYIASRPDLERKEYAKKLYKFLTEIGVTENEDQLSMIKIFSMFSSGELSAEQLKSQWAEKVLQKDFPERYKNSGYWVLYDRKTKLPVTNGSFSGTQDKAIQDAMNMVSIDDEKEFNLKYVLKKENEDTNKWDVVNRETGLPIDTFEANSREEAQDIKFERQNSGKYSSFDVYNLYLRPHVDYGYQPPSLPNSKKLSPRTKLATKIKKLPKKKWAIIDTKDNKYIQDESNKTQLFKSKEDALSFLTVVGTDKIEDFLVTPYVNESKNPLIPPVTAVAATAQRKPMQQQSSFKKKVQ